MTIIALITAAAAVAAVIVAGYARRDAKEATRQTVTSNKLAGDANELAATADHRASEANHYAREANTISKQARADAKDAPNELARRELYRIVHDQLYSLIKPINQARKDGQDTILSIGRAPVELLPGADVLCKQITDRSLREAVEKTFDAIGGIYQLSYEYPLMVKEQKHIEDNLAENKTLYGLSPENCSEHEKYGPLKNKMVQAEADSKNHKIVIDLANRELLPDLVNRIYGSTAQNQNQG